MKRIIVGLALLLSGCASKRYQVVILTPQDGSIMRLDPQSRQDADIKAAVINATVGGQVVAWVQHKQAGVTQATPMSANKISLSRPREQ
jgi:hypothetical protein